MILKIEQPMAPIKDLKKGTKASSLKINYQIKERRSWIEETNGLKGSSKDKKMEAHQNKVTKNGEQEKSVRQKAGFYKLSKQNKIKI